MKNELLIQRQRWTLSEFGPGTQQHRTLDLPPRELIVGRSGDADVIIPVNGVSKRHAKLSFHESELVVEDLSSTNGTFLNGEAVTCTTVQVGDLLQFANAVYKVGRRTETNCDGTMEEGILPWAQTLLLFDRLLSERAVVPHFQPIITLEDRKTIAQELLARSDLDGLNNPALMFGAAERLGQQAALSELMRHEGLRVRSPRNFIDQEIYVNTHPSEVVTERLVDSLKDLRADFPTQAIVVEIHEASVTDPSSMREFRSVLSELEMKLSYDDFGSGQGRLAELGEVPPDVLKFDMQLIRSIDSASKARQDLLASLVQIAIDLGTIALAEGVETEAEHRTCLQMGFQLGQGFLYGRPQPQD